MKNVIYSKQLYRKHDEDWAYIRVTEEANAYFVWIDHSYEGYMILDWSWLNRDAMIEKAVDLSRMKYETLLNSEIFVKKGAAWAEMKR